MIDLLLCAPSREALIGLGILTGFLPEDVGTDIPAYVPPLNIHEIGTHSYFLEGSEEPVEVDGWWVMLRAEDGTPVPEEIGPFIVERDPENPEIPTRVWA